MTTYMLNNPSELRLRLHFLVNTPTIVATVDAALAAVIVVLVMQVAEAPRPGVVERTNGVNDVRARNEQFIARATPARALADHR
jgi:hypothetical protein